MLNEVRRKPEKPWLVQRGTAWFCYCSKVQMFGKTPSQAYSRWSECQPNPQLNTIVSNAKIVLDIIRQGY